MSEKAVQQKAGAQYSAESAHAENRQEQIDYDVIIVGGGPAGLTAALYLARARYRVLVVEKEAFGGQIRITAEVVNYPGVEKTDGHALTETMRRQAEHFGAEFLLTRVKELNLDGDVKTVITERGALHSFGVLLATGAHPRMIGFEGEAEYRGHGVAYCATCDGEFFTGKPVFVIGGGFAAAEESVFLTKYASHVTILMRGDDFSCAKAAADAARNHEKISILPNMSVDAVGGDNTLRWIKYHNTKTGEEFSYHADAGNTFGVFVFAGYEPETELVRGIAELDEKGYIVTGRAQQTNVPGLYAAGDICEKNLRQVVTAVGDGALAATELERYVAKMQEKTGLRPAQPAPEKKRTEKKQEENNTEKNRMSGAAGGLFSEDMLSQLDTVFARMETPLELSLYLDTRPVSAELSAYMEALSSLTEKLHVKTVEAGTEEELVLPEERPCVRICRTDGQWTGLAFHGVPGGHEFTSFVLGLYNASGPGQALEETDRARIVSINRPVHMRILVSLSCTMCPELVTAAQRIASLNALVTADVYDLNHFPNLREQYQVMSVPCLIINEEAPVFGKKNVHALLELLGA